MDGKNGDLLIKKAPACAIQTQAEAVSKLFGGKKEEIKVISIRHGEKMYETLQTNEECAKAVDMGEFYRVPADNRGLNYDKYFKTGDEKCNTILKLRLPNQALWCIIIMASWKGCGMWMMYLLAGLKGVDTAIYESARLDGAGYFTTLTKITLPLIKRTMLFVVVANTTSNMLLFAPSKLITEGGPQNSTNVLMYEVYKSAFRNGNMSRAGAITAILLVIIMITVIGQFKMMNANDAD